MRSEKYEKLQVCNFLLSLNKKMFILKYGLGGVKYTQHLFHFYKKLMLM